MSKLIYITESQYKKLVEDGPYLNVNDTTNPYRYGGPEVTVNGVTGNDVDDDVEMAEPTTTDEFAKQLSKRGIRGLGRAVYTESNQDLDNRGFQLSQKERERLAQTGTEVGRNLAKKGRISYDYSYKLQNDLKNGKADANLDPNGTLFDELNKKTETAEDISRNRRESDMAMGKRVMKYAPKTGAKGGAHTPNGNNTIGVSYK
jgi:hypothetical protein